MDHLNEEMIYHHYGVGCSYRFISDEDQVLHTDYSGTMHNVSFAITKQNSRLNHVR